jgi:hypothetical protein
MSSREDTFRKNRYFETGIVSDFGVGVVSSMFARTLRPGDMFYTLESQLEDVVISVVFAVDMDDSVNIRSW